MKTRELENLGFRSKEALNAARQILKLAGNSGKTKSVLRSEFEALGADPAQFLDDPLYGALARLHLNRPILDPVELRSDLHYASWGDDIDADAHRQMANACRLPVSRRGALMPDAHVGYGLPIGGVLATEGAVIPYAVGVDIACRVMVSVIELNVVELERSPHRFEQALERETRFGMGAKFKQRKHHEVLDEDWYGHPVTRGLKDVAWSQLGTSGSGNHFVEFGSIEILEPVGSLTPGTYAALVSHSGSRGPGAQIAAHYSALAQRLHPELPRELIHLAWLPLDGAGAEYWHAMELMGRFASANHHLIHRDVLRAVGAETLLAVENHHNYAWKEVHGGREYVVHRKGATPAGKGVLGYIPGSMAAPGYLVEGLGNPASLDSAAHGAGRALSRTQAKNTTTRHALQKTLREAGVRLLSAGLDESPHAYKNIDQVMKAQSSLVRPIGRFMPKIVKMAPEGERAED